ncbi:MAG TPA: SGNH/GDSL hydrolase family protein [Isosphaeraceae bacterium]|jgi:lysophospholipase L1-like esterase|nr:SGNH/GDSL hydrolase family protein [Isosphaeraceae bacterium]
MKHSSNNIVHAIVAAALLAGGLASPAGGVGRLLRALADDGPNRADYERMERGYYEHLIDAGARLEARGPRHRGDAAGNADELAVGVDDLREYVLKPSFRTIHRGAPWSTNALGMRDREYEVSKPPGTFRVALLGDSIATGWGVDGEHGFDPLLERALDARSRAAGGPAVEVLDFAVPGHAPGQRWEHFARVGGAMGADLVLYEGTAVDAGWDDRRLRLLLPRGLGWDSPLYRDAIARAGLRPGMSADEYRAGLRSVRRELLEGVYRTIVAECRARGMPAFFVLVPRVGRPEEREDAARIVAMARRAGFAAVFDLSGAYDGHDPRDLAIADDDYHPNALGHALLARRLEAALVARPELRRLWSSEAAP